MRTGFPYLRISATRQQLDWITADGVGESTWSVSTARNGLGERRGSECTPRGWHVIRAKIGEGQPLGTVFKARRPTGEVYDEALAQREPGRDWILTRILWLGGLEPGFNRYGSVDTTWRYIYLHGSPDSGVDGQPRSHGCIRLRSADICDLFSRVQPGLRVWIGA
jgi:lipoprotein-anchoring transpeptidase ErfK/SrfK